MLEEMAREIRKGSRGGSALEPRAFRAQVMWAEWGGPCGLGVRVTVTGIRTAEATRGWVRPGRQEPFASCQVTA